MKGERPMHSAQCAVASGERVRCNGSPPDGQRCLTTKTALRLFVRSNLNAAAEVPPLPGGPGGEGWGEGESRFLHPRQCDGHVNHDS